MSTENATRRTDELARFLCGEIEQPWDNAEWAAQNGWRWVASQALKVIDRFDAQSEIGEAAQ